ncbi:MAG: hypothetical protein JNK04_26365, partial [Myxococcales bacterium]|nr:hypothetical protein [Myxococcales bacterium]
MPTAIRHVSRAARLAVSLPFALGLGCSTTVEPPLPSELVEVGVTPPASTPVAAISSASAGPAANVAASATAPGSDPTSFPCSDVSCRVGETCCSSPTVGHCIATVNDGPGGAIGYLKTQWDQCAALPYRGSNWSRIARCDESDDCAEGKVCCEGFLFSGSDGLADCLDLPKNGKTPCDFAEVCMAGSKCRTPGTTCIKG